MTKTVLTLAMACLAVGNAWAHGEEAHARKGPNLEMTKTAFGQTGVPARVSRTVQVDMSDSFRFNPSELSVRQGDTVRFVVKNSGKVMHELVLGTDAELQQHAEMMKKFPNMEHDEPYMAHVAPGKRGEIVWQFTQVGEFKYGCLVPGHFEAGMVGRIRVVPR